MGHAITISRPLHYHATPVDSFDAYRVNGTPPTVWRSAHTSGTRSIWSCRGSIWGSTWVTTSGTRERSRPRNRPHFWRFKQSPSAHPTRVHHPSTRRSNRLSKRSSSSFWKRLCPLVNVNLPTKPRGTRWTRQSVRHYEGSVVPGEDPMGRAHYWLAAYPRTGADKGTDRWALENNYVSLTPLRLDLTDEKLLTEAITKAKEAQVSS